MSNRDSKGRFVKAKPAPEGAAVRPFQVGDRVKSEELFFVHYGKTGTVGPPKDGYSLTVVFDGDPQAYPWGYSCPEGALTLLEPAPQPKAEETITEAGRRCNQIRAALGIAPHGLAWDLVVDKVAEQTQQIASLQSEIGSLKAEVSDLKALLRASRIVKGICASGLDDAISRVLGQS